VDQLLALLALVAIVALVVAAVRILVRFTVVHDYERGLRYRSGRLAGLVDAGTYLGIRGFSEVQVLDVRPTFVVVEGQEVLTSDGVAAKVSLAARYMVADAAAAITRDADFRRTLYLSLQLALRDAIARRTLDEALADRRAMGPEIREACAGPMAAIGVELLDVDVRDVMLPGDLKRAFAGVVAARKEGEAALERSRTEIASLRSLANAGRMLDDNPGLLQLRILQELGQSSGNTVVFGAPETPGVAGSEPTRARRARTRTTGTRDGEPG
jgi:regulator of protease activity HflC (stomatin/prohibitin superfamily)